MRTNFELKEAKYNEGEISLFFTEEDLNDDYNGSIGWDSYNALRENEIRLQENNGKDNSL